jgi:hypothetical protein
MKHVQPLPRIIISSNQNDKKGEELDAIAKPSNSPNFYKFSIKTPTDKSLSISMLQPNGAALNFIYPCISTMSYSDPVKSDQFPDIMKRSQSLPFDNNETRNVL